MLVKKRPKRPVSRILFSAAVTRRGTMIIHLWTPVARRLVRPTRELGRATLKHSPIWSCTGWGLPSISGHPEIWCALTAPFHPYPGPNAARHPVRGGIFSVALSFALPRLHVMKHPALWCSDFPPAPGGRQRSSGLLRPFVITPGYCRYNR